MSINYVVRADVVDLRADTPRNTDRFLVDTNVWGWITYTRASFSHRRPKHWQARDYPDYINRAIRARAGLHHFGLSLPELASVIERTECDLAGFQPDRMKECRHNNAAHQARVVGEVKGAWEQVKSMSSPIALMIDGVSTDEALAAFETQRMDGYDIFLVEAAGQHGITQIITDDGDYCSVPGIRVFTSNQPVLNAATVQGKLLVR